MKVLIISHNPITTYQNMGKTFLSLFSVFKKEELCQLYIYPTIPDVDKCSSYYRVTDRDIIKSYFRFGKVNSRVITSEDINLDEHSVYENIEDASFYKNNKKNSFTLLCRDLIWSFAKWYDSSLKKWLLEERPTCIFLAPGESKFIYDIALRIAKKLKIEIITYVCDEFYFVSKPARRLDRLQVSLLQKKIRQTIIQSKQVITICDELANEYYNEFGTDTRTIYTGSSFFIEKEIVSTKNVKNLVYMGNLSNHRYESIAAVGETLDILNKEHGTEFCLLLYTTPIKESISNLFSLIKSIRYVGYVTGNEFDMAFKAADMFLHVESFDVESIERVKHSISTKIADCLGSGKVLFAYGPANISSIQHLIKNECAIVATNKKMLKDELYKLFYEINPESIINKALETAELYHSSEKNSKMLYEIMYFDSNVESRANNSDYLQRK